MLGVLADQLLGDELTAVLAALAGADGEPPHAGVAVGVPVGRLAGCAADAQHVAGGELVGERVRECGPAEHGERLEVLGDAHGVGPGGDLVVGETGRDVCLQLEGAAVELVVLLVHLEHPAGRRLGLGVGVVDGHGVGQVVDDRVVVGALVEHDLDRVGRDAGVGGAAVVALERREALGREEVPHGHRSPLGVAPFAPVHLDALRLGVAERQRERDLGATASLGLGSFRVGAARFGSVRLRSVRVRGARFGAVRFGRLRRSGRVLGGRRGCVVTVVVSPRDDDESDHGGDDEHDRSDRPPLLQ